MPRETIDDPRGSYSVKVGWSQDQGVQVGVAEREGRSLYWVMLGDHLDELGTAVAHVVDKVRAEAKIAVGDLEPESVLIARAVLNHLDVQGVVFESLWSDLDRHRCNRLINLLRKARDAAFGADA